MVHLAVAEVSAVVRSAGAVGLEAAPSAVAEFLDDNIAQRKENDVLKNKILFYSSLLFVHIYIFCVCFCAPFDKSVVHTSVIYCDKSK